MGLFDGVRAKAFGLIEKAPGKVGEVARRANEALGRPLATAEELADRAAFEGGYKAPEAAAPTPAAPAHERTGEPAPVIVYHLDKHRRDIPRLTQVLDGLDIPYRVMNLEGDPATQAAVRRDSGGRKLPLVFVAGECVGAREELNALEKSGELVRKVWPG
jgi:glutaredoxin